MTRALRVRFMYHLCVIIAMIGVYWQFGIGWAAMSFGVVEAAYFLFIAEADEEESEK